MTEEKKIKPNNLKTNIGFDTKNIQSSEINTINRKKKVKSSNGIPKEVANRMARRIAFATGIPTISGMGVFIGSYILISRGIADISPTLTLVSSAACFLVGLIGLSYGILSASWEASTGSLLGFENIRPNFKRMKDAFKNK